MARVNQWTGYTSDTRRYSLSLTNGGLYTGTRYTPYSKCSKSFQDKGKYTPDLNDYDPAADRKIADLTKSDKARIEHLVSKTDKRRRRG